MIGKNFSFPKLVENMKCLIKGDILSFATNSKAFFNKAMRSLCAEAPSEKKEFIAEVNFTVLISSNMSAQAIWISKGL